MIHCRQAGDVAVAFLPGGAIALSLHYNCHSVVLALTGGEDYELLFTVPAAGEKKIKRLSRKLGLAMTCIGEITGKRQGLKIIGPDGKRVRLPGTGFRHF